MERRKFTREFKLEAVKLIQERGVTVAQASRDLACMARCCADGCRSVPPMRRRPFRAADKPGRPMCAMAITLHLHCTPDGVALIA